MGKQAVHVFGACEHTQGIVAVFKNFAIMRIRLIERSHVGVAQSVRAWDS